MVRVNIGSGLPVEQKGVKARRIRRHRNTKGAFGRDFSAGKPSKSDEVGHIKLKELIGFVKAYFGKGPSPQLMAFLSGLDRSNDGWVFFEDFRAGLTPELLGRVEDPEGVVDKTRKSLNHGGGRDDREESAESPAMP